MPKVSVLPEDILPTLDDFTYNLDSTSTTAEKAKWSNVLKMLIGGIYPVGCIFTETTGVSPATSLGFGTWAAFGAGRVLIGAGTSDQTFTAGATGGESNHVLSWSEMPVHNHGVSDPGHSHTFNLPTYVANGGPGLNYPGNGSIWHYQDGPYGTNGSGTGISINNAGGGAAHNTLPPYIVVYFWKRTA